MAGKITLTIVAGPKQGDIFTFDKHDIFLCGRMSDNHISLPNDKQVSRHHCILELNPPSVRIRDLGSRNGTYINSKKHGGREKGETPAEGAKRWYPTVDLQDGDKIGIGQTTLAVSIEQPKQTVMVTHCNWCHKDVTDETQVGQQDTYICSSCRHSAQSDLPTLFVQTQTFSDAVPGYELLYKLREGGMGAIYIVKNKESSRLAALKVMLPHIAVDEEAQLRFRRELETTRSLRHKNIVEFIGGGIQRGAFFFLLEYCEGGNLYDLMMRQGGKLTLAEAAPLMLQALEGLAYAHNQGFIHRDLKPQNILLAGSQDQWIAKIADLGLAKSFEEAGFSGMTVTSEGFAGSCNYMPREQITNFKYIKPVSDVWAIGASFYHMLTGRLPRPKQQEEDTINMILKGVSIPIRQRDPGIPPPVATVIDRSLSTNEKERYQNAGEMHRALQQALQKAAKNS